MHPYSNLPDRNFWRKFVPERSWRDFPFNDRPKFTLDTGDRVATAGSCFAQHIARYMRRCGMQPYIAEPPHTLMLQFSGDVDSYHLFSARYGNIYTVRQCLELLRQALGQMPMIEDFAEAGGRWFDLLRPNVEKNGYACREEACADRAYHLSRVRVMFETANVFIFTLGLTESWFNVRSGHTYPACPGTVRGDYDPALHQFRNFTCAEVVADLEALLQALRQVNPGLKIILTVSPVPLVATHSANNVLVASSYSKSVLRAAVGEVEPQHDHVAYFPSYEIISHAASFGQYLAADLREVTERGVGHVMDCFLTSYYGLTAPAGEVAEAGVATSLPPPVVEGPPPECEELFNSVP